MEGIHKVGIDLLFCAILAFLTIHTSNSLNNNEQLSRNLSAEAARISAEN